MSSEFDEFDLEIRLCGIRAGGGRRIVALVRDTDLQWVGNTNVGWPRPTDAATNCCVETDDTCASCWSDCRLCG